MLRPCGHGRSGFLAQSQRRPLFRRSIMTTVPGRTDRVTAGAATISRPFSVSSRARTRARQRSRRWSRCVTRARERCSRATRSTWNLRSTGDGQLYLLQVRPLARASRRRIDADRRSTPPSLMSPARLSCSAGRILTCMAAARYSGSCRTGIRPKSSGCGPDRCRCRSIAS